MSDSRRIIMTTAVGYQPEHCQVFLTTLRNTGYKGDIVFFVESPSPELQQMMKAYGVTAAPIRTPRFKKRHFNYYPFIVRQLFPRHLRDDTVDLYENWIPIISSRFIAYRRYFKTVSAIYDECLLCDMRDVYFQANPFEVETSSQITFYEEYPHNRIDQCPYNREWVKEAYGEKALKTWGHHTVICAGTTHLKANGILRYLDAILLQIQSVNPHGTGVDQALHNFIARNLEIEGLSIVPQAQSKVLNIGTTPTEELTFNKEGLLTNTQGEVAAIVHQYDRHSNLFEGLIGKLCAKSV